MKVAINFYIIYLTIINMTDAKTLNSVTQDILRSETQKAVEGYTKNDTLSQSEKNRKDYGIHDSRNDRQFLKYITDFSTSPTGKLLDEIIRVQLSERLENVDNSSKKKLDHEKKGSGIAFVQIDDSVYHKVFGAFNVTFLLISSLIFLYIVIYDPLSNYCITTISAHIICSLILGLTHDVMPMWLLIPMAFFGEGITCVLLQFLNGAKRRRLCTFSVCMVGAKVVYDAYAIIPIESINPLHTGLAGLIVNFVLFSNNFMLIRLVYLIVLFLIAGSIFTNLPSYVASEPMELDEIEMSARAMKKIICIACGWPIAALVPQLLCSLRHKRNPLGPFSFFFTPVQFRLDSIETYVSIVSWVFVSVTMSRYVVDMADEYLKAPPNDHKWWRRYARLTPHSSQGSFC